MEKINLLINEIKKYFKLNIFDGEYNFIFNKNSFNSSIEFIYSTKTVLFEYSNLNQIGRLILATTNQDFNQDFKVEFNPNFNDLSIMIDCARNNVLKVNTFKKIIRYISLLGYTTLKIYLEDVFEVDNEPYFGYLRGRYSKNELKEIVLYASIFNIEVIPCIETLAHLNQINRWSEYRQHFDIDDILLVDDSRVNLLIDNMFKTLKDVFITNKVNIGMDEAHNLGRGRYLDKYGYLKRIEILKKHLATVLKFAKKYDFKCEMWGDMFFNNTAYNWNGFQLESDCTINFDDLKIIYWDYDVRSYDDFNKNIKTYKKISENIAVAGGAWKWNAFSPCNIYSLKSIEILSKASINNNIKEFTLTLWGDNGGEASIFSVLPCILYASNVCYNGVQCEKSLYFKELFNIDFNDFLSVDLLNRSKEEFDENNKTCINRVYLYNDLLLGIYDSTVNDNQSKYFLEASEKLKGLRNHSEFGYIFDTLYNLSNILELKVNLGIKLRQLYKTKDFNGLKLMIKDLERLNQLVDVFYDSFFYQWHLESKGNGFDVQDLRIGGLKQRIRSTIKIINLYLDKKVDKIEELEEKILDVYGNYDKLNKEENLNELKVRWISSINVND